MDYEEANYRGRRVYRVERDPKFDNWNIVHRVLRDDPFRSHKS